MTRRLAAVLIADVAGYGRLSRADEEGTRVRFQADLNDIFKPKIAAHDGRLVNTMGDGLLVEFHSVVDAVRCAIDVQGAELKRNAGLPIERRMEFRIGINLGDVIVEGDDIHGDGVIIAERLQALADEGGIAISAAAYEQVKTKLDAGYEYLGEQRVKNIAEPLRVYRVLPAADQVGKTTGRFAVRSRRWSAAIAATLVLAIGAGAMVWWHPWEPKIEPASVERMALPLPDKPSIAVLPFANMSDDPKQEYFADGMTDDLITELSKVSGLFVISRNSTFIYKGKTVSPKQVSEEFGVRYVLEGSVQRAGDRLRINAQLIDALTGGHAWADHFDGSLADVFALQDKVTSGIADALAIRLSGREQEFTAAPETTVPAAYDAFLRGWEYYRRTTPDDYAKAIPYFEEAIRLDPNYARAHAALAMVYVVSIDRGWWESLGVPSWQLPSRVQKHLDAAAKHPTSTYYQASTTYQRPSGYTSVGIAWLKKGIALDPSDSWNYAYLALAQIDAGQAAEAGTYIKTAMRLDPHYPPFFLHILGLTQLVQAQFVDAAVSLERATKLNPDDEFPFLALAATYGHLGRTSDASAAVDRYNAIRVGRGGIPLTVATAPSITFTKYASTPLLRKGLRLAGVPENLQGSDFATKSRLAEKEIRALFLGHRLHGRTFDTGDEHEAIFTESGTVTISGDWGSMLDATVKFTADEACFADTGGGRFCAGILRNPGGSRLKQNEFIWLDATGAYTFSQIE